MKSFPKSVSLLSRTKSHNTPEKLYLLWPSAHFDTLYDEKKGVQCKGSHSFFWQTKFIHLIVN